MKTTRSLDRRERVLLVGVSVKKSARAPRPESFVAARESLTELEELAHSAGAHIEGTLLQVRDALDPATLVGRGKLDEIRAEAHSRHVPLVIVDHDLTPVQLRNMEKVTGCHVIDRTQLILDIFARHARSREGQLQVELAQLNYLLPRLSGRGTELSRLGGGIGTRGPGEQKLETDRRRIRDRVGRIEQISRRAPAARHAAASATGRPARHGRPSGLHQCWEVHLVQRSHPRAAVLTSPKMFATLDPTIRAVRLPSRRRVLLSDTVGFVRDLPPDLIAAFRATLEEVQEAAVIVQVSDISSPQHAEQDAEVLKVLKDLGVQDRPQVHVLNKIDRLPQEELHLLRNSNGNHERTAFTSAVTGQGLEDLLERIDAAMPVDPVKRLLLRMPVSDGRSLSLIQAGGRVLHSQIDDGQMLIDAEIPQSLVRKLEHYTAESVEIAVEKGH